MKTTTNTIAGLFGAEVERKEFERSARDRAASPQTAPLIITTTIATTATITTTITLGC